ncbi:winged helix-turn-helix transcriptional regulator [Goodfellowiella coeruleoviolacea]|uniref:Transcriptional regulator, HxlR family n=1 Tax=Goodfellowiella coeruleoviolacea TaxID=334858 RepID=A0AAE3GCF0_9PSEU|nr:helix-turn-helix domain-containing protein [Goodfellowiella coeruleoviolacea]MCP2165716.1 transcriptional regulator, HxlR family [Goodfellowiella coeruleoviolacea]
MSDPFNTDCPGRAVLNHVTSRWGTLVLAALWDGPLRFHVLRDRIGGISEKMLSQTLRVLTRDGLLDRVVEPTRPPQVSYELTAIGREVAERLTGLVDWIRLRMGDILAAQQRHDRASGTPPLPEQAEPVDRAAPVGQAHTRRANRRYSG